MLGVVALAFVASVSYAQQAGEAKKYTIDTVTLAPTAFTGVTASTFFGDATKAGVYSVYAVYAAGAKSMPHTHPDVRVVTILKGTAYMGFGPTFNEADVKPYNAGEVVVIPANTPHYTWAKDGMMLQEETGYGPSGTTVLPAAK